jgi:hypothetical protein
VDPLDAILSARDLVAVLGREVAVRLVDISSSGCLLESTCRLEEGTTGVIRVQYEGGQYVDEVRIMRCRACEGSSAVYQLGAEFLWTTNPRETSLRRVLAKLQVSALKSGALDSSIRRM